MAKFNAGTAVESLDWDFTAFGGGEGTISEPTTGAVNAFTKNVKGMLKEVKALQKSAQGLDDMIDIEEMDEAELAEKMGKVDEASEGAELFQRKTLEHLAELCGAKREVVSEPGEEYRDRLVGGSPSLEQLEKLPYRHLQAFSQWLMGEIRPKKTTPGTGP